MSIPKTQRKRLSLHTGQWHSTGVISQGGVSQILIDLAGAIQPHGNGQLLDSWRAAGIRGRVLDIGCGTGWKVKCMSSWPDTLAIGCDNDHRVLAYAAARFDVRTVARAECDALPFQGGVFDWVTASEVLEHLASPERMLMEVWRVLKPQGCLLLTTPNRLQYLRPWRPRLFWYGLQRRVVVDESHVREFSDSELHKLLAPWFRIVAVNFVGTIVGWPRAVAAADLPLPLRRIWAQGIELVAVRTAQ